MPAHENPALNKLYYGDNLAVLGDYIPEEVLNQEEDEAFLLLSSLGI